MFTANSSQLHILIWSITRNLYSEDLLKDFQGHRDGENHHDNTLAPYNQK